RVGDSDRKNTGCANGLDHRPGRGNAQVGHCLPAGERGITMLKEHERVVLLTPIAGEGLEAGDVGTIVYIYRDGQAYEVEFVALDGHTRAVATVEGHQVRAVSPRDMTHAREIQPV